MNEIDVIILTWNDGVVLDSAVASAVDQQGVRARVTVLDNGSTVPAHVGDARVRVIRSIENLGVGRGRNRGVAVCDAPFVCFLDSDARLHPGSLARLLAPLLEEETIGLSAPVFAGQQPSASAGRAPTLSRKLQRALNRTGLYAATPAQGIGQYWDVDFAIGACQLFRRDAFDAVGGLDDSAGFGPEDVDFCLRLQDAGWRIVQIADAGCDHPARRAFRGFVTKRGLRHSVAVARHLWRRRRTRLRVPS
jgi:N-acetylglucosaminyl-diphospho-decaprenol L-rhamnosyltransferase